MNNYAEEQLRKIMEPLYLSLLINRPKDIINYSIEWLMKEGGITANGLTIDERHELITLRKNIKKYREIAEFNKEKNNHLHHHDTLNGDESEEDEKDNDVITEEEMVKKGEKNLKGPRIAVSAEAYGNFNKKGSFKAKVYPKSEDKITSIKVRIIHSFLFNSLDTNELKIVIDAMEEKIFNRGEVIIEQGDFGDCLYLVDRGELECYKKFSNCEEKMVKKYNEGEAFGELSLLYNCPRAARVVVSSDRVVLWKLDREKFNAIVKESAMYFILFINII